MLLILSALLSLPAAWADSRDFYLPWWTLALLAGPCLVAGVIVALVGAFLYRVLGGRLGLADVLVLAFWALVLRSSGAIFPGLGIPKLEVVP